MPVKPYRTHPALEGAAVTLVTLVALLSGIYFIYVQAKDAVEEEIREGLVRNVSAAATTIDGDLHRTFTGDTDPDDPAYVEFLGKLEAIRQASAYVQYLYTCISVDGQVYFIANPSPQGDIDGDGQTDVAPQLMDLYEGPGRALLDAIETQTPSVDQEPYTDQWGTFYGAYAPFYDSQGRFVGVLGMDLEQGGLEARLQPTLTSTRRAALTTIVIAILCGVVVWFCRRVSWQLSESRVRLGEQLDTANQVATDVRGFSRDYLTAVTSQVRGWLETVQDASASAHPPVVRAATGHVAVERVAPAREGLDAFLAVADAYVDAKSGVFQTSESDFDLAPVVEALSGDLESAASTLRISLTWSVSSALPPRVHGDWAALSHIISTLVQSPVLIEAGQTIAIRFDLMDEGLHDFVLGIRIGYTPSRLRSARIEEIVNPFGGTNGDGAARAQTFQLATARLLAQLRRGEMTMAPIESDGLEISIRMPVKKSETD
jgi:hypothetical protein